jgi:hypothetical protein
MSKAQVARINGAKSNGPVTEEGKAISSRNSLKHGLTSACVVLPHESQEEYDRLEASLLNRFRPYDEIEQALVQQMASSLWRLRRIDTMEAALYQKVFKQQQELLGLEASSDEIRMAAYAEVAESKGLRMLSRHQGQLRRAYEKAWKELELIQEHRSQEESEDLETGVQNEPMLRLTPRAIHAFINAPIPATPQLRPQRNAAANAHP